LDAGVAGVLDSTPETPEEVCLARNFYKLSFLDPCLKRLGVDWVADFLEFERICFARPDDTFFALRVEEALGVAGSSF